MSEARRSPLNALVVLVLAIAAVALLPAWRPIGPAGVPVATLADAPQGIAHWIRQGMDSDLLTSQRVWSPQIWGSWIEFSVPRARVAVDSRIELFPAEVWTEVDRVTNASAFWLAVLDRYEVDVIIVAKGQDRLFQAIQTTGTWVHAYADADGDIWVNAAPR